MAAGVVNGSKMFSTKAPLKPHIMQKTGGLEAEVQAVRDQVAAELLPIASITVDEFTDGAAAVANGIKLAVATVAAITSYTGAALDGAVGGALMPIARNITILTAGVTPADAPATATITGTYNGKAQTETITVAQTNTTATGLKPFDKVTKIDLPAADGTAATLAFGFGAGYGTKKTPKSRAGGVIINRENVDGSLVTTGALTSTGLYTPATAPNGAHDYAIYYEFDPLV